MLTIDGAGDTDCDSLVAISVKIRHEEDHVNTLLVINSGNKTVYAKSRSQASRPDFYVELSMVEQRSSLAGNYKQSCQKT